MLNKGRAFQLHSPLFCYALAMVFGIVLGTKLSIPLWALWAGGGLSLLLALLCFKRLRLAALLPFALFIGLLCGFLHYGYAAPFPAQKGEWVELVGMVADRPEGPDETGQYSFLLQPESLNGEAYDGAKVKIFGAAEQAAEMPVYGDMVRIEGVVFEARQYQNPGSFDYQAYLSLRDQAGSVSFQFEGSLEPLNENRGNPLMRAIYDLRGRFLQALSQLPERQQTMVRGVFLGDKTELTAFDKQSLGRAGILHAFAVSGLHVGYVVLIAILLVSSAYRNRWWRLLLGALLMGLYLLLVGFRASVMRATIMAFVALLAKALNEDADMLNSIGLAAILLLLYKPPLAFDAGFQLSFCSVAGMALLVPVFERLLPGHGSLSSSYAATGAATLGVMPMVAYYYHNVTVWGLLLSPFFLIIIGAVVILSFFALLLCLIGPAVGALPLYAAGLLMDLIYHIVMLGNRLPFASFVIAKPRAWMFLVYYLILALLPACRFLQGKRQGGKWLSLCAMVLIVVLVCIPFGEHQAMQTVIAEAGFAEDAELMEAVFLDVGQGDCALLRTPAGRNILIDGGGQTEKRTWVGENIVVPYLQGRGIDHIDVIVASHPHDDHIGGLFAVLELMSADLLLLPQACEDSPAQQELQATAQEAGTDVLPLGTGDRYLLERGADGQDIYLEVYAPDKDLRYPVEEENGGSLICKISYGQIGFLFTGDSDLQNQYYASQMEIEAEVVKVPHHGSAGNLLDEFYESARPQVAVISAGADNSYGHPHSAVLDYLEESGVRIYRTDQNGAVQMWTDGSSLYCQPTKEKEEV